MGNPVAYLMLLAWPMVVLLMFRKLPPVSAFLWAILGGYMVLPQITQINLPMIPAFDKVSIPNITAFAVCVILLGMRISPLPRGLTGRVLLGLFILGPVITALSNTDPIRFGVVGTEQMAFFGIVIPEQPLVPGLRIYDSVSFLAGQIIFMLPFFLARHLLAAPEALSQILRVLVIAGLIYSVPMMLEAAIGPQLHLWVYGFLQHDYSQSIRGFGFRPYVFMDHGLWVALFAMTAFVAAVARIKTAHSAQRGRAVIVAAYLALMLALCQSLGPILMAVALAPLVLLASPHLQMRLAALIGALAMAYPMLRGAGLIPTQALVSLIDRFNPARAQSLEFRFLNEDMLLARAAERPWFGWGGWGRNQVFDPLTGQVLSITDGQWIITIGMFGWLGYIATFGLLCLPLVALWWQYRATPAGQVPPAVGPLALLLAANVFDLLPNATLIPMTWLLAGAILGHAERACVEARAARQARIENEFSRSRATLLDPTLHSRGSAADLPGPAR